MKKVLVIGSINMDFNFSVDSLPEKGQTVFGKGFYKAHGGKGANQALTIARLGGDVQLVGVVGDDAEGREIVSSLKEEGINTNNILITKEKPTGMATITVAEDGNNTIVVNSGANQFYPPEFIEKVKKEIDTHDIIVCQFEIPYDIVKEFLRYAKSKNKCTILNPAPAKHIDSEMLSYVDYLMPNESEFSMISQMEFHPTFDSAINVVKNFYDSYKLNNIIVTLGKNGSIFMNKDGHLFIKPFKVTAVDTTGAGDGYLGAFVYGLSNDWTVAKSLEFATKVSAYVVTKKGAQTAIPTMKELEEFLK